jgi:hypothetical protein
VIEGEILPQNGKISLYGGKNFEKRLKYTIFAGCIDFVYKGTVAKSKTEE